MPRGGRGGRRELRAGHVARRDGLEFHVAAPPAAAPGERVQERDRPVGLGRVGVLPDPGPRVVGDRARLPEEARGCAHLAGRNPGDAFDPLRRILPAEVAVAGERGPAGHLPRRRPDPERTFERPPGAGAGAGAGRRARIDGLRRALARAPRDGMIRVAARGEVRGREQAAAREAVGPGARAGRSLLVHHQERPVRPVLEEAAVEPAFLDHHSRDPEGERPVRARPHPEPLVRLRRQPRAARVDHDEPRPPRLRFVHPLPPARARRRSGCGPRGARSRRSRGPGSRSRRRRCSGWRGPCASCRSRCRRRCSGSRTRA